MTCRPSDGGSILFLMWLVCVVLVFVTLDSTADAATAKIPLALMKGDATDIINTAYINGAKAAFQGEGNTLHNGAALSLQPLVTSMNLVETIATMSADTIFFGIDDEEVLATVVRETSSDPRLFFAPYTTTDTLRRWNESIFFTRTDPTTELLALLGYLVANDAPRKVGFMLLYDSGLGLKEWDALNTQLNLMGSSSWSSLYNASMREDVVDPTSFQNFITSKPQAVFVFGVPCPHTTNFFTQIITNPVMVGANIPILMPMALLESLSTAYVTTLASPTSGHDILPASNIFFSSTNPISTDTRFAAVSSFTTEMTATTGAAAFDELTEVELTYSMAGWVSGKVLLSALNLYGYEIPFSGPDFLSKVFQQSRYIVGGDFIVGNYGGAATPLVVSQGGIQECNQGGHLVTVNSLSVSIPDGGAQAALATPLKMVQLTNLPAYDFVYPLTQCYAQTWSMIYPVNLLLLNLTDGPSDGYIADRMVALQNTLPSSGSQPTLQMLPSVASIATSNVVVNETSNSFNRIMLSGILPRSVSVGHLFVLDPIDFPTGLRRLEPNVIYLSATLEQQLFVLANYIGTATPANTRVHAVIRRRTGASAITSLLENSLRTFRRSLDSSITDLSSSSSLVSHLSFTGINIAVGLRTVDIDDLATFLSEHTQAVVAVAFQDFTMLYESFWEVFSTQPASVQDRLIFATNLPSWTGVFPTGVSASPSIDAFLSSGGPSVHNPASVQTFIMSKTVASLVKNLGRLTPSALEIALYNRVTFPVAMLPFGNYQNNCTTANNLNSDCLFNYGAQRIAVWSFRTITSGALLMQPVTPTMLYSISTPPKHNHLLIIILASVFGGVCVLGLLFVLLWCCLTSVETRDNRHAPKDGAVPVTLIFTDIESSTALWATVPEEMSDAVQLHHRLIRGLIAKYRCYEVKTIGDAFMISSSNAYACVRLARDLQVVFKRCNWGSQAIDEAYRSFHQAKGQHVERDEVAYSRAWNGLRVRVGIHTGLCTIRYDEVTKGFDYYGETPNIAARVESLGVGGQVLLTEQAVNSLTDEQLMGLPLERLGPNKLRGLSQIVVIHQLNAIEARNFSSAVMSRLQAAERAAEAGEVEEHGSGNLQDLYALMEAQPSDEEDETDERRANEEVLANDLFAVYHSPFRQQERRRLLERSCQRFGLFGQHRMYYASDEEYHRALIHSLATRASSIVRYNRRQRPAFSAFEWRPRTSSPLAGLRRRNSARRLVARVSSREDFVTNDTTRDPSSTPLDDQESGAFGPNPMSPLSVREGKLLSFSKSEPSDLANNFLSSTTMGSYEASDERAASPRTVGSPRLNHDDSCVMRGGGESGAYVPLPVLGQVVREGTSQALDFPGSHLQSPLTAESVWPAHFEQLFRHGRPTFVGDTVVSCFSAGDGMLFRICDSHTSRWAFYNDSPHYTVRIKFSMGRKSRIVALGNTHLERNPETQRMEGTVVVSPLSTEMLVAGFVNGYIMRYNMVIVND